ncbi:hypothetical protein ASPBRDRAFT_233647 [Aspergillus brasiliensis CBS 101740]|uniref:Uncharacterized protein n=1 Tax=Aspergillus brasiliensis (strain CBS 101740 / IMI 381727 / IBT 21946) TaxID=767769 RepID=A0A1L9V011_ASPBC|nr:hypothetical protein ASPBRDRAFT_233647 [Aspergillus brasiliensis CBS 101740]
MRLINTKTFQLEEYFDSDIPEYAILSHTWGKDEVSFQDIQTLSAGPRYRDRVIGKEGFLKIKYVCQQATRDGLDYAWVDTCCINRSSSVELSEAINSMFKWYMQSSKCYVYLSDVPSDYGVPLDTQAGSSVEPVRWRRPSKYDALVNGPFARCRWFTRGWTLQELIAPKDVTFYGSGWNFLGTKVSMTALISTITGIAQRVLRDSTNTKESLRSICVAEKMSWAARRQTSKVEDEAYCLVGLFGVHMPILYGEGKAAFIRLQEEIIKRSDDHTIFAWNYCDIEQESQYTVLAPSSSCFLKNVVQWSRPRNSGPYTMTNRGLHIPLPVISPSGSNKSCLALLDCHYEDDVTGALAIPLTLRSDNTYDIDYDSSRGRIVRVDLGLETRAMTRDLYIRSQPNVPDRGPQLTCQFNIDQDDSRAPSLSITEFYPSRIWDAENSRLQLTSNDSTSLETWAAIKLQDTSGRAIGVVFHISPQRMPERTSTFGVHGWIYIQTMKAEVTLSHLVDQVIRGCASASAYQYGNHGTYTLALGRRHTMVASNTFVSGNDSETLLNVTVADRYAPCTLRRVFGASPRPLKTVEGAPREKDLRTSVSTD